MLTPCLLSCATYPATKSNEEALFYNYGLTICLGSAFEDKIVKADFNKSANGYMEHGNMPIETYEELRASANRWLEKNYPSKNGDQVNSKKCLDFHKSKELFDIFKKYDPCKSKDNWLDLNQYRQQCAAYKLPLTTILQ